MSILPRIGTDSSEEAGEVAIVPLEEVELDTSERQDAVELREEEERFDDPVLVLEASLRRAVFEKRVSTVARALHSS